MLSRLSCLAIFLVTAILSLESVRGQPEEALAYFERLIEDNRKDPLRGDLGRLMERLDGEYADIKELVKKLHVPTTPNSSTDIETLMEKLRALTPPNSSNPSDSQIGPRGKEEETRQFLACIAYLLCNVKDGQLNILDPLDLQLTVMLDSDTDPINDRVTFNNYVVSPPREHVITRSKSQQQDKAKAVDLQDYKEKLNQENKAKTVALREYKKKRKQADASTVVESELSIKDALVLVCNVVGRHAYENLATRIRLLELATREKDKNETTTFVLLPARRGHHIPTLLLLPATLNGFDKSSKSVLESFLTAVNSSYRGVYNVAIDAWNRSGGELSTLNMGRANQMLKEEEKKEKAKLAKQEKAKLAKQKPRRLRKKRFRS